MRLTHRRTFLKAVALGLMLPAAQTMAQTRPGVAGPSLLPPQVCGRQEGMTIYDSRIVGGPGGEDFADLGGGGLQIELPPFARVRRVIIRSNRFIDGIQLVHSVNGRTRSFSWHGGFGGTLHVFTLDYDEHITGISGRYGKYLDSLVIHTNKRPQTRYGGPGGGCPFLLRVPDGYHLMGFSGRSGVFIDAVGIRCRPGC